MSRELLIVDDDPFIRSLVAATLQDVAGFHLRAAPDGRAALRVAAEHAPALVLLDVEMPGLDGIEVCRRLRGAPATAGATIVILAAVDDDRVRALAEAAGADLVLAKPFSPLALLRLVDRLGDGDHRR